MGEEYEVKINIRIDKDSQLYDPERSERLYRIKEYFEDLIYEVSDEMKVMEVEVSEE